VSSSVPASTRRSAPCSPRRPLELAADLSRPCDGIDVIVPTKDRQRTKPRRYAPPRGREAERIEAFLFKPEGKALYRRRQQVVEPGFADTKFNRRADRFMRHGVRACNSKWRLIAATHNRLKLWRAGLAAEREGIPQPTGA
jgi:hypothetical protein